MTTTVFTLHIFIHLLSLWERSVWKVVGGGKYAVSLIYNHREGSKILRKSTVYQELSYPKKNEYRSI